MNTGLAVLWSSENRWIDYDTKTIQDTWCHLTYHHRSVLNSIRQILLGTTQVSGNGETFTGQVLATKAWVNVCMHCVAQPQRVQHVMSCRVEIHVVDI